MEAKRNTQDPGISKDNQDLGVRVIGAVMGLLQLFFSLTLSQRIVCLILLSAGVPDTRIRELTGYAERSIRRLRKELRDGKPVSELLRVGGGKPKAKTEGFEEAIFAEIESHNYSTRREIADMIADKFGITVSETTVGRLLKKKDCAG